MATLHCLGSSSEGNCYIISCSKEKLIIDLGVSWNKILKSLNYNVGDVAGCLVSHRTSL